MKWNNEPNWPCRTVWPVQPIFPFSVLKLICSHLVFDKCIAGNPGPLQVLDFPGNALTRLGDDTFPARNLDDLQDSEWTNAESDSNHESLFCFFERDKKIQIIFKNIFICKL